MMYKESQDVHQLLASVLAASFLSQRLERKWRRPNLAKKFSLGSKVVGALGLYHYFGICMNDNLLEFKRN